MADSAKGMSLTLFIDKNRKRVLYAEASKAVVDFLFNFLTLPLGTVTSLVMEHSSMVGCLGNLYKSVENLDLMYMETDIDKNILLKPKPVTGASYAPLSKSEHVFVFRKMYKCEKAHNDPIFLCSHPNYVCRTCSYSKMNSEVECATSESFTSKGGYVKTVATYMVTDDLEVKPMSTIPIIALLNKFNVKDVNELEEKKVDFGTAEALKLLAASLRSNSFLTDVFMRAEGLQFAAKSEPL